MNDICGDREIQTRGTPLSRMYFSYIPAFVITEKLKSAIHKRFIFEVMETKIVIKKDNKKVKEALTSVKDRKNELKAFLASGGNIEDFHPKKPSLA